MHEHESFVVHEVFSVVSDIEHYNWFAGGFEFLYYGVDEEVGIYDGVVVGVDEYFSDVVDKLFAIYFSDDAVVFDDGFREHVFGRCLVEVGSEDSEFLRVSACIFVVASEAVYDYHLFVLAWLSEHFV